MIINANVYRRLTSGVNLPCLFTFQVENFLKRKEELFGQFYDLAADIEDKEGVEGTDQLREDVKILRKEFSRNAKETWNTVMSQEMTLVTQTEQVRKEIISVALVEGV